MKHLSLSRFLTFFILNKEKRRIARKKIDMRLGDIPQDYKLFVSSVYFKHKGLVKNADKIDTIFLGDSHGEFGGLPFLIGENAYNYAMTANGLYEIYNTLKIATKTCPNLKNVICFVSFYQRGYSEIRGALSNWCQALERLLGLKYDYSVNKSHNYELTAKTLDTILENVENPNKLFCQGYGFSGLTIFPPQLKDKERAAHHFKIYQKYQSELVWLKEICRWAQENQQHLYLINSPARSDYIQVINNLKGNEDILSDIKNTAAQFDATFYNFNDDFVDDDLADSDHLNFNGAVKLTQKIIHSIYPPPVNLLSYFLCIARGVYIAKEPLNNKGSFFVRMFISKPTSRVSFCLARV